MIDCICPCEQERQRKLLDHLHDGQLTNVPPKLLLKHRDGTRPAVKLVAYYPKLRQVFAGDVSIPQAAAAAGALTLVGQSLGINPEPLWTMLAGRWGVSAYSVHWC